MGNICDQVCDCHDRKKQPKQLIISREPAKIQPVKAQSVVSNNPKFIYQPVDSYQVVTLEEYGEGPHPSTARISKMPKLTDQQIKVLQRELPLNQPDAFRGTQLQCFFLNKKRIWYEGDWMKGLPNGKGKAYFQSGAYFEGLFKNGYGSCKQGIVAFPEGSYYKGEIKNSMLSGKGTYYNAFNRLRYTGDFNNNKPEGYGFQEFGNGNRYEGYFKDGYKQGKGKFIWRNGMVYVGDFNLGYMEGMGTLKKGNGTYSGQFYRNQKVGKNVFFNTQTGRFEGQLKQGLMNGQGQFVWNDQKRYIGGFKNGELHGKGKIEYPNGQKVIGTWQNGVNLGIDKICGI